MPYLWVYGCFVAKIAILGELYAIESAVRMERIRVQRQVAGQPLGGSSVIDIPLYCAPVAGVEERRRRAETPVLLAARSRLGVTLALLAVVG